MNNTANYTVDVNNPINRRQRRAVKFNANVKKEKIMSTQSETTQALVEIAANITHIKNDNVRASFANACSVLVFAAPMMSEADLDSAIANLEHKVCQALTKTPRKIDFGAIAQAPLKGLGWLSGHVAKATIIVGQGILNPVAQGYKTGVK